MLLQCFLQLGRGMFLALCNAASALRVGWGLLCVVNMPAIFLANITFDLGPASLRLCLICMVPLCLY